MKVRLAYLEEPPFYWTTADGVPTGADIELADVVLRAIGADVEHVRASFEELLPGVQAGRWDMNVPIFVTAERAARVAFSAPVWTLGDGLVVHRGNPKSLASYASLKTRDDARLGVIPGQVQYEAARSAGLSDAQLVEFKDQPDAVAALLAGTIDAFTGTALGGHVIVASNPALELVRLWEAGAAPLTGAFSFGLGNARLRDAVNRELRRYLGSADHRARMARYGLGAGEIDGVLRNTPVAVIGAVARNGASLVESRSDRKPRSRDHDVRDDQG
jgi:polar amino acid transport system substrate-binding protein